MLKFSCPPQKPSGSGTFSDNLVGLQLTQGGGLTLGNFIFTNPATEKVNRSFDTGTYSAPYNLKSLDIKTIEDAKKIFQTNFKLYPNFDTTDVLNFVGYGSLSKRFEASVYNIINHFPASMEANVIRDNYSTGKTATQTTSYLGQGQNNTDIMEIKIDPSILKNPFSIDYTEYATQNIQNLEYEVSDYRNFTKNYKKYVLIVTGTTYPIVDIRPPISFSSGTLTIYVEGIPFNNSTTGIYTNFLIRPSDFYVNEIFNLELDEVDEILLNRFSIPIYTSTFQLPTESENGNIFIRNQTLTWPLDGEWNVDISSLQFQNYVNNLQTIGVDSDSVVTNLLQRFYTTESLKEFDTDDQKVSKVLRLYGRSFDDSKKYIDSISHSVSVNYNVENDIPSGLLTNFAETIGWKTNVSPIQNNSFLTTLYQSYDSGFSGMSESYPLEELQNQYYRNLILNSSYIFKSKGTRRAVEFLMKFIGAPDALLEFNESVYLVDNKFPLSRFNELYLTVQGGTFTPSTPILDQNNIYRFFGTYYTGYTASTQIQDISIGRLDYPVDNEGYPTSPAETESMFFQKGSGWFESTPYHTSPEMINLNTSVFKGENINIQTNLEPFTYGQKYLDIFRNFPYLNTGFGLQQVIDNKKSWNVSDVGLRKNSDATFDAYYEVSDDRLVLNVKNVELFLNPAQAITYDVWYLSNTQNYPIPFSGLSNPYPEPGGVDWTEINPQPQVEDFFKFKKTFWTNMINVRNRQQSSDGKTSGYPTLQSIFWKYLSMYNDVGIENNNFTYQNMVDYVNSIGSYWVNLVEQVIPATTIWNTGTRFENSVFHRQKFAYRPQRGCLTVESDVRGPQAGGGILPNNCGVTDVQLELRYNLNLIQTAMTSLINEIENCSSAQIPYIQQLKYKFTLNVTKGNTNLTFNYTDTTLYVNPNILISESSWNTFIINGFNSIEATLLTNGITVNDNSFLNNKIIILETSDCVQIEIAEFNLDFSDVTINCA